MMMGLSALPGVLEEHGPLADSEVAAREARQHHEEPREADGPGAEAAHVRVERQWPMSA